MAKDGENKTGKGVAAMKERSAAIRSRIEAQIEQAERRRKQDMLRRRLEIAGRGVKQYELGKITEAVKQFETYIRILEEWKGAPEGGLTPEHFDKKTEVAELLLISGIYWDLAKVYDHTKSPEKVQLFRHYLNKHVLFTRGYPYQALASETLRKYLSARRCKHTADFKAAYKAVAISQCFVVTSLVDLIEDDTLDLLRQYRDEILIQSNAGRGFIRIYYALGPTAAWIMDRQPRFVRVWSARRLDRLSRRLFQHGPDATWLK